MLSAEDNELLTRTGPGTAMGGVFRSYWLPVMLSEQLPERDGPPQRIRILGEDLLAFRDSTGRVALIEPRCPHRGADLFFGRNEDGGIRCAYHGWMFDATGACVEMPTMPPETAARVCDKARIKAYPTTEGGGFVWAYLGDARGDDIPAMPQMEFLQVSAAQRHASKKLQECNWAQAAEGGLDTAHFSFLHMPVAASDDEFRERAATAVRGYSADSMNDAHVRWMRDDPQPRYHVRDHAAGLLLGASRRAGDTEHYWRIAQFLMPCHGFTPSAGVGQNYHGQTWVPIDDESCWIFVYTWNPERPISDAERAQYRSGGAVYAAVDSEWVPIRRRANTYLRDEQRRKFENFTGIEGVSEQDAAIQDSQGRIADRTRELLGPTDIGVVRFRRLMLEAARGFRDGRRPKGVDDPAAYRLRAGAIVTPADADFEAVMDLRFGNVEGAALAS